MQSLNNYLKATPYLDSEKDIKLRERVLEALTQAGYLKDRLEGSPRVVPLNLNTDRQYHSYPESDHKVTLNTNTTGNNDVDYQEKLAKLQKKITKFEEFVEEKDRALLEQEH